MLQYQLDTNITARAKIPGKALSVGNTELERATSVVSGGVCCLVDIATSQWYGRIFARWYLALAGLLGISPSLDC